MWQSRLDVSSPYAALCVGISRSLEDTNLAPKRCDASTSATSATVATKLQRRFGKEYNRFPDSRGTGKEALELIYSLAVAEGDISISFSI